MTIVSWLFGFYGLSTFAKFCLYVYTFNQGFLDKYLVGKIFYK